MDVRWKKLGKASIIEIVGSLLLLLCLFLPWFLFVFGETNSMSFTFLGKPDLIAWTDCYLRDYYLGGDIAFFNFGYLLYLLPILCIVNIVVQYFVRVPWLSFYVGVSAIFAVFIAYYHVEDMLHRYIRIGDISDASIGFGVILAGIISLFLMISSWTSIGWKYKTYWVYIIVIVIWCIISFLGLKTELATNLYFGLCILGSLHAPFLIYALLVALCSYFVHSRNH